MGKNLHIHFEEDVSDDYLEDLQKKILKVIKGEDVLGAEVEGQVAWPEIKPPLMTPGVNPYPHGLPTNPIPGEKL